MPEMNGLAETQPMTSSREQMTAGTESGPDRFEDREKTLCVLWRLEAFHLSISHSGRLMRVLGAVVEIAALPMLNPRQDLRFAAA